MKKNIKRVRISVIINVIAIALCVISIVINFMQGGGVDAAGCGILASNLCIFFCNYPEYKKLKEENKE